MRTGAQSMPMGDSGDPLTPAETNLIDEPQEGQVDSEITELVDSKKWPHVRKHIAERQEFYQKFMPDGRPVKSAPSAEVAEHWRIANAVIDELDMLVGLLEGTANAVKQARKERAGL